MTVDRPDIRRRSVAVLAMFAASLTVGIVLIVAFEPEVQTIDAAHDCVMRAQ